MLGSEIAIHNYQTLTCQIRITTLRINMWKIKNPSPTLTKDSIKNSVLTKDSIKNSVYM